MKPLITWLHLSDIHFGHGSASHGWDQQLILSCLNQDVARMRGSQVPSPELILVTGDIAFSGASRVREAQQQSTEYQEASTWLRQLGQRLGIPPARTFTVPGNHDVQRSADREPSVAQLVEDLREGRVELDAALADPSKRALLARRQANYLAWAAEFAPACAEPARPPEERLFWSHRLELAEGVRLRLVGLNTALLSASDSDQGKLRLGNEQLARALLMPPVEPGELTLMLSHHPLRSQWMADERNADAWIRNHAHLHLSGHVHEADSEQARSGTGGQFVRIVAGAAHGEQQPAGASAGHGYNIAAVCLEEGGQLVLRVWPRRWSDKHKLFLADQDNIPEGKPYAEHPLRGSAPAPSAPAPSLGPVKNGVKQQIDELHGALIMALRAPGFDDKALVLLSNTAVKLKQLIPAAPEHLNRLLNILLEWEHQLDARLTPQTSPEIRRLFAEHQRWISEAFNSVNLSRSDETPVAGPYGHYETNGLAVPRGLKLLLGKDELGESEGIEWLLAGGFSRARERLEQIKQAGHLEATLGVLWRRLPRIRLYHPACFLPLHDFMRWSNRDRWEARLAKVKDCCDGKTRREDAEALLASAEPLDKLVLASCLLTHEKKACRDLAIEVLPAAERWDALLCEDIPLLIVHDMLLQTQQDCGNEYIKVAFLLLRPRLAAVSEPLEIKDCFRILKIFYSIPLFMEDTFFRALQGLYGAVATRAFGNPVTQALARELTESIKSFFARQPTEDAKVSNLRGIPLPIQRKLAREGHFIEYFICSTRDPIAFETVPHVMRNENAVAFFRIPAINANALDCLAGEKKLNTQYPIRVAFCKNPKAKTPLLVKFIPTLHRHDLKAISLDKMATGFAREHASKILAIRS